MKKTTLSTVSVIIILLVLASLHSDLYAQERLVHFPVTTAYEGQEISMSVKIEGAFTRAGYIRIYYRHNEQESFRYEEMNPDVDQWVGTIPASEVYGDRLQYFLSAFLLNETIISYPAINPYNEPEDITILATPPEQTSVTDKTEDILTETFLDESAALMVLSPEPNEALKEDEVVFAVSFNSREIQVDSSSVRLYLDGINITSKATISSYLLTLSPRLVRSGRHRLKVTAQDMEGNPLPPVEFSFTVMSKKEKQRGPSQFRGHIFSDLRQEQISEENESFAMGGADFNGEYGGIRYNGRMFITSLEDNSYQPRNRFKFGVQTKYVGIEAGDTNPYFNDLILWGKRVRGLSGYVHLGFFNVDVVFGQTYRGIEGAVKTSPVTFMGDTLKTNLGTDSLQTSISRYGTYEQNIFGIRPSFGSGKKFQLGFSLVKTKDDKNSIKFSSNPKDNLVFGPDLKLSFDRGRFVIKATSAISFLTNNITHGPLDKEDIEEVVGEEVDIPFNPGDFEKWLIINDSTTPLDPTELTSVAHNISLKLNYFRNMLRVGYKSIGSEYFSLANYWIRKDIKGFYFSDRMRLLQNKLYLTLGYEDYTDHFSKSSTDPELSLKTLNYAISYYPGNGLPNVNISVRNHYRDNDEEDIEQEIYYTSSTTLDTLERDLREDQLTRDISVQVGYDIQLFQLMHTLSFNYITADRMDNYNRTINENSSDIRLFTLKTKYNIPLQTTVSYAYNKNMISGGQSDFKYDMFGFGANYSFWENRFSTFGEMRFTNATGTSSFGTVIDYTRNHFRLGALFQIQPRHTISLDANILSLDDKSTKISYTDTIFRLRYDYYL